MFGFTDEVSYAKLLEKTVIDETCAVFYLMITEGNISFCNNAQKFY